MERGRICHHSLDPYQSVLQGSDEVGLVLSGLLGVLALG